MAPAADMASDLQSGGEGAHQFAVGGPKGMAPAADTVSALQSKAVGAHQLAVGGLNMAPAADTGVTCNLEEWVRTSLR